MADVNLAFVIVSAIIALGFASEFIFKKTGIPDILWLIIFGLIIGPLGNVVNPQDLIGIAPYFSALAIMILLFDSGINLKSGKLLREVPHGTVLAIAGFAFSVAATAIPAYLILRLGLVESILLGCILGGTDSSTVVPLVSGKKSIREKTSSMLEIESIITDPITLIIPIVLLQGLSTNGAFNFSYVLGALTSSFSSSIFLGIAAGVAWPILTKGLGETRYSYTLTIAYLFFIFAAAGYVGGSGAIACFITGLVMGNIKWITKTLNINKETSEITQETKTFNSTISFFVRSFFFVFMGATINIKDPNMLAMGLVISLVLLGARHLAVHASVGKAGFHADELTLSTYMLPRGLSAAVMAPIPAVQYGLAKLAFFTEIVSSVIIFTTLITTAGTFLHMKKEGVLEEIKTKKDHKQEEKDI
ncbi:MAG: cation:proton antiporter [Candidatus Aenigmarchaeota archaeon]|nr:cation:proton antiporter [Candidatus Aenigmarchaeota archaeon]